MPWRRAFLVWCALIAAETLHGIARTLWLVPLVGDFRSRQIGVAVACVIIGAIAWLAVRWLAAPAPRSWLGVGVFWVGLTLAFEIGVGHFVIGQGWERFAQDYDLVHGGLMPLGLVWLALAPLAMARLRGPPD